MPKGILVKEAAERWGLSRGFLSWTAAGTLRHDGQALLYQLEQGIRRTAL